MRILGLVTARGGSKGVPRKNIKLLCGKPLLAYTALSALAAKSLSRVVLSTDDEEIARVGIEYGLQVPFLRPSALAADATPTLPVVQHALSALEKEGEFFDAVCLLQPTNPLRRAADIDACADLLKRSKADSVVSVLPVPHEYNPLWVYWKSEGNQISLVSGSRAPVARRQDLPTAYHRDGSIYLTRRDVIVMQETLYGGNILGYEINQQHSANIDTEKDWLEIERRLCPGEKKAPFKPQRLSSIY